MKQMKVNATGIQTEKSTELKGIGNLLQNLMNDKYTSESPLQLPQASTINTKSLGTVSSSRNIKPVAQTANLEEVNEDETDLALRQHLREIINWNKQS